MTRAVPVLAIACALAAAVGLLAGGSGWRWELHRLAADPIVLELRAPRVVLAALVGGSLAAAGLAMQALLHNDLAEPYVLGLSGGASLGAVLSLTLWPWAPPGVAAAAGAGAAAAAVRTLSRGHGPARLLLSGVTVGSLAGSGTGLVLTLAPESRAVRSALFWLFGGLGTPAWSTLVLPALALLAALVFLQRRAEQLDRLSLGDEVAASLGVPVRRLRRGVFLCAVGLTAVAVAMAGLIGFVGLVAPHAARRLIGERHGVLLATAALLGALFLIAADTAARAAFAPREVPVGLLTALVGGPLFLLLLRRSPA